jgi:hypothetical protein
MKCGHNIVTPGTYYTHTYHHRKDKIKIEIVLRNEKPTITLNALKVQPFKSYWRAQKED